MTPVGKSRGSTGVVIATHADQALGLLTDPSDAEVQTLKAFGYSRNETVLHTDSSPQNKYLRGWTTRIDSFRSGDY